MLLIGMFDSPFVRRVAISMQMLGLAFEHANWSVGRDFERIRRYNPLVRVPTLMLDDGQMLCDSAAILDYLDERVGAERALLPPAGAPRRQALNLIALSMGAADKARESVYESAFRPADKRHAPWVQRCLTQMHGALERLEQHAASVGQSALIGGRFSQADISVVCAYSFITDTQQPEDLSGRYPALARVRDRCEQRVEFRQTRLALSPPST